MQALVDIVQTHLADNGYSVHRAEPNAQDVADLPAAFIMAAENRTPVQLDYEQWNRDTTITTTLFAKLDQSSSAALEQVADDITQALIDSFTPGQRMSSIDLSSMEKPTGGEAPYTAMTIAHNIIEVN